MSRYLSVALAMCLVGFTGMTYAVEAGIRVGGGHRDGYSLNGGKVMFYKGGTPTAISQEVVLTNGARILPDGYVVFKDGRRERISEGGWVTLDGEFVAADAPVEVDGYYWRDGKVYVMRGGQETVITTEVVLTDGSRLEPDGAIILKDGTRNRFSAGMRISLDGKISNKDNKGGYRSPDANAAAHDASRPIENRADANRANENNRTDANRTETNRNDPNANRTEDRNKTETNRTEPNANRTEDRNKTETNRTEPNANRTEDRNKTETNRTEPNANRTEDRNKTETNRTEPNANRGNERAPSATPAQPGNTPAPGKENK